MTATCDDCESIDVDTLVGREWVMDSDATASLLALELLLDQLDRARVVGAIDERAPAERLMGTEWRIAMESSVRSLAGTLGLESTVPVLAGFERATIDDLRLSPFVIYARALLDIGRRLAPRP